MDEQEFTLRDEPLVNGSGAQPHVDEARELPRSYGRPTLVAIARDPHTLFAYWDVDWSAIFGADAPAERAVFLRVLNGGDAEELRERIEPLAGNAYLRVANPDADYQVELGFKGDGEEWQSIAISDRVITPRDSVAYDDSDFQLATIPLHLRFQELVEIFRGSKFDAAALTNALAEFQRAFAADSVSPREAEVAEQIGWRANGQPLPDRQTFGGLDASTPTTRARLDRILGIAPTSPTSGFGGGS